MINLLWTWMAVLTLWGHLFFAVKEKIFWSNKFPFCISDSLKYSKLLTRANSALISKLPASPSTSPLLSLHWVCLLLPRGHPLTTAKWVFMPFVCFSLPAFGYFHFKGNSFKMLGKVSNGARTVQLIKSFAWLQKRHLISGWEQGLKTNINVKEGRGSLWVCLHRWKSANASRSVLNL